MFLNFHTHQADRKELEIFNLRWQDLQSVENRGKHPYFSAGIHPQDSLRIIDFASLLTEPGCLAIGECGLDKIIGLPLPDQLHAFEAQINLSEQYELPLVLHCVKAWNEVQQVRKQKNPKQTWIFHGFRKTSLLESVLSEGLLIGIGTAVLYDERLQKVIAHIPDDKLLLETDSDEMHVIEEVYAQVAALKSIDREDLERIVEQNFRKTFSRFK